METGWMTITAPGGSRAVAAGLIIPLIVLAVLAPPLVLPFVIVLAVVAVLAATAEPLPEIAPRERTAPLRRRSPRAPPVR